MVRHGEYYGLPKYVEWEEIQDEIFMIRLCPRFEAEENCAKDWIHTGKIFIFVAIACLS